MLRNPIHCDRAPRSRSGVAPPERGRVSLRLCLIEESEEAGRRVDWEFSGKPEQMVVAGDKYRALGLGESKEVVVSRIDGANPRGPVGVGRDRPGGSQPPDDAPGFLSGDPAPQLRIAERSHEFVKNERRDNEIEVSPLARKEKPSGGSRGGEEPRDGDVRVQNGAQGAQRRLRRLVACCASTARATASCSES